MADGEAGRPARVGGLANRLGALALVVADRASDAVAYAAGRSESAAAALSSMDQFLNEPSIELLARVLGLTHSGAVRLVDRLEHDGYVRRRPGGDGRSTAVALTASGRRAAARVATARAHVLDDALGVLSPAERRTLDQLVGRVLVGMMREPGATRWMCRLCDLHACGRDAGDCPVGREVHARYFAGEVTG